MVLSERQQDIETGIAVQALEAALVEQARLSDSFDRAAGTSSHQASYARLRAASRHVAACDRTVKALPRTGMRAPARPPPGTRTRTTARRAMSLHNAVTFAVDGGLQAPAAAREQLRARLGPDLDPEIVELAQLLMSELVNNCVHHGAAARPDVRVTVTASLFPSRLRIEVGDGGPPFVHQLKVPPAELEGGRGLWFLAEMASRWGVSSRNPGHVWFDLPRG
jgi:anti-sigma regulatory factor (Ser/Thr protein kinase)